MIVLTMVVESENFVPKVAVPHHIVRYLIVRYLIGQWANRFSSERSCRPLGILARYPIDDKPSSKLGDNNIFDLLTHTAARRKVPSDHFAISLNFVRRTRKDVSEIGF